MPSANLARLVLLEARRGGLPWLAAASIALSLCLAAFLSQVALPGSLNLQAAIVAALLRPCALFLIPAHVSASLLRGIHAKRRAPCTSPPRSRLRPELRR